MQNNVLAFRQKADVIKHSDCLGFDKWLSLLIHQSWSRLLKQQKSTATAAHNLVGLQRLEKSRRGVLEIPGLPRESTSKSTFGQIRKQVDRSEKNANTRRNSNRYNILLECSTNVLYYFNRAMEECLNTPPPLSQAQQC
jgi:hypothetical protein